MKRIISYFASAVAVLALLCAVSCDNAEYKETKDAVYIANAIGTTQITTSIVDGSKTVYLIVRTAQITDHDVKVTIKVDKNALDKFNAANGTEYEMLPEELYDVEDYTVVIKAGTAETSTKIDLKELTPELNKTGLTYVLSLSLDTVENGPEILPSANNYLFALAPVPFTDVPVFKNYCVGSLYLAEDMDATTMTFESLICYASNTVSVVQKGHPFTMFNNAADANPTAVNNGLFSRLGDAGKPGNHINGNIRGRYDFPDDVLLTPFQWHHLAFVFDLEGKKFTWYLDGIEVLTKSFTNTYGFLVNKDKIYLGRQSPTWGDVTGVPLRYAECRLWNTIRTPEQLKNNMYGVSPNSPGLVGYWKLSEGEGTVLKDATGKNPDGEIAGASAASVTWITNQRVELGKWDVNQNY